MYEYKLVTISNTKLGNTEFKHIDNELCYFNNYISDYMLLDDEDIIIKSFNNNIFNNKELYHYNIFSIYLKFKIPNIDIINYICSPYSDFMLIDSKGKIYKDFSKNLLIRKKDR